MANKATTYTRRTYGLFESIGQVFNAIGNLAALTANVSSAGNEFTYELPELGHKAGRLMHDRMDQTIAEQRKLLEEASK